MVGQLISSLVGWFLVLWLVHWFAFLGGCSVDWFLGCLVGWLVSRSVGLLVSLLFVSLVVQAAATVLESSKEGNGVVSVKMI